MRKKFLLLVVLLLTLLKNVFSLFWTTVVCSICSICSNFWFFVTAFLSAFSFFKATAFEALDSEVFTLNLYFLLIMFRLMKWTRNQKVNNRVSFRFVEKTETLYEFNLIEFLNDEKTCRFNYINKAVDLIYWNMLWSDMCFRFEIRFAFVEIADFNCRLPFRIR